MAKEYYDKLSNLINELDLEADIELQLVMKHFFNGAALYINGVICASWSPVGLAFKLPEYEVNSLISCGEAKPLKYFPKGHVKKGYVLFEESQLSKQKRWKEYFLKAAKLAH